MKNEMKYFEALHDQLESAKKRLNESLHYVNRLTKKNARDIIGTYKLAIEPNFIPWMQIAYNSSRHMTTKNILLKNIEDEINEDHPKILRVFAESSEATYDLKRYQRISQPVREMWDLFSSNDHLAHVAVAAALENTSLVFIPYLVELGKKAGCTNFTYTDKHGEADIKHAEELYKGLIIEGKVAKDPISSLNKAFQTTTNFLERILTIYK